MFVPGTRVAVLSYRMLGATVGDGAYIKGALPKEYELITIGQGVTLGEGAELQTWIIEGRMLKLRRVHVGSRVYVGEHSIVALGALVGQDTVIMPLSIVPRFHNCKPGSVWTGSPGQELNADECKGSALLHTLAEHKQLASTLRGQGPGNEMWPDLLVTLCLLCLDTFYTAANLMPALLLYLLCPTFNTAVEDSDVLALARFLPVVVYGELLCVVLLLAFVKRQCVACPVRIAPVASLNYLHHRLGARCLKLLIGGLTRGFVESVFIQPLLYHVFEIDIRYGAEARSAQTLDSPTSHTPHCATHSSPPRGADRHLSLGRTRLCDGGRRRDDQRRRNGRRARRARRSHHTADHRSGAALFSRKCAEPGLDPSALVALTSTSSPDLRRAPPLGTDNSVVPQGAKLSDNTLLGVYSCSPAYMAEQSTYLGSPAFLMENRKQWEDKKQTAKPLSRSTKSQKQQRDRTYSPPLYLWSTRLLFNLIKIAIFPFCGWASLLLFIFLRSILYPLGESSSGVAYVFVIWAINSLAILLTTLSLMISCILAKWLLVGRYTAGQHPMYSTFIWRVEWVYEFEMFFARVAFIFQGTPYIIWMLRAYGMRIGRNVFFYNNFPAEFDLISIGDGATISRSVMQTHLYEDRMFKTGPIVIGPGVAVDHGIVLYNSEMAEGSSLAPVSLVMRGERIEPFQRHFGLPSIPAVVPPPPKGSEELCALREVALDALREVARAELRYHEAARARSQTASAHVVVEVVSPGSRFNLASTA